MESSPNTQLDVLSRLLLINERVGIKCILEFCGVPGVQEIPIIPGTVKSMSTEYFSRSSSTPKSFFLFFFDCRNELTFDGVR